MIVPPVANPTATKPVPRRKPLRLGEPAVDAPKDAAVMKNTCTIEVWVNTKKIDPSDNPTSAA